MERMSFICGPVIKKNIFLLNRKQNKTVHSWGYGYISVKLHLVVSEPTWGRVTEAVFFDYFGTETSVLATLLNSAGRLSDTLVVSMIYRTTLSTTVLS